MARVFRVFSAALVSVLVVGFTPSMAVAQADPEFGCTAGELVTTDEAAALTLAAECDQSVEIALARGFAQRQYAEPDGTVTLESYLRPRWAYDDAGNWVEADPTLVVGEDGVISTVATVVDVAVSAGGIGPLVTATDRSGASISLSWPVPLPAPVLDGATATYPSVYPGVDLRVTARTDSFSYALVVHSAEAALNPALADIDVAIGADGLAVSQAQDGSVTATDASGAVVFSATGASMWDSSAPAPAESLTADPVPGGDLPGADPGRVEEVGLELTDGTLTVVPDQAMLADADTVFPVTIDPTFTASKLAWTVVGNGQYASSTWWDDAAWPRSEGLRIGFQGWTEPGSEGYGRWRSIATFDVAAMRGATINDASVRLTVFHTGGCESYPLQLWATNTISHGAVPTSWNSTAGIWQGGSPLNTQTVASANGTGDWCAPMPNRAVTFGGGTLLARVQQQADMQRSTMTFGLRAGDEADIQQWMRAYTDSFVLEVNYTPVHAVPTGLTVDGVGCLAPAAGRATGSAPMLDGVPRYSEGTARGRFEVRAAGGSTAVRSWLSGVVPSGQSLAWQVDPVLPDGEYEWRMRTDHPTASTSSAWSSWCSLTVDAALNAEPPPEAAEPLECPIGAGEPAVAADESMALLAAAACGTDVEALSERDFASRVMARPDGVLMAEEYTQPQWALDEDGAWAAVDPSFEVGSDGSISTAAAVSRIEVSDGGEGPLLTATNPDGGSVSLSWPGPLPSPVLDGNMVTYPEVFDDVDLQVAAGLDGFSYVLVVKSAAAAASPELASVTVGIQADGLTLGQESDGSVAAKDAAGEVVFSAPAAYIWDSSTPEEPVTPSQVEGDGSGDEGDVPPGQFTQMPLELAGGSLTVEPDQALLADPDTEFPVFIDPPFSGKRKHWASVHQQQPSRGWTDDGEWPREGGMRVGNLQWWEGFPCGDSCGLWRSAIRFDTRSLAGKQIISASVKAVQTHTSGCGSYGLQLWDVALFTSGVSWNGMSSRWNSVLQTQNIDSSNRSGGCTGTQPHGVTFGGSAVRSRLQRAADTSAGSVSFGFQSSDEVAKQAYRRIAVNSVKLEVEYNRPAQVPTTLRTDGHVCDFASPGPWVTTQRPTLTGNPRDPDGRVGTQLQVYPTGSSTSRVYQWTSARNLRHNTVVNHRITKSLPSGSYRWRMRSLDNDEDGTDSDWRQWCYFRIDATSPTPPKVELIGDPPVAGEQVTLRFTASDAGSGLAGFWYGVNKEAKEQFKASSGTTTVTVTAPSGTPTHMWIYVWAQDKAGNDSNRAVFDFFSPRIVEATPAAAWRLDGDGLDDTGNGHELLLGNGVGWQGSGPDRWLGFDGSGCVATAGPVVRTDAEYTVAAWVRLDDASVDHTIMSVAGHASMGFSLRYYAGNGRWRFHLTSVDAREVSYAIVDSATPAQVGVWTHLAVTVDPAGRHIRMYVNGMPVDDAEIGFIPWHVDGPLYLGCSSRLSGNTWYRFQGAIHHAGVWRGLLTEPQVQATQAGELPAGLTGDWRLRADGADASLFARNLTVPTTGVSWVDDQFGRQRSALRFNGTSTAEHAAAVVRTDQSFSVAAWVKLDDRNSWRTAASQAGDHLPGFQLGYRPVSDRWAFNMASQDAVGAPLVEARSLAPPVVGQWYHLVGVYDRAANQLRLYVDGQLERTVAGHAQPWRAGGPLIVGSAGTATSRTNPMVGAVSTVQTWRGALTAAEAAEVYGGNPAVRELARWNMDGTGTDEIGSNGLTLVGAEGVDYEWVDDQFCFPFSAFGLRMSGQGYARTGGAVLRTDESYTVAAWVKVDAVTGGWQTFLAQRGANRAAFYLQVSPTGGWRFSMSAQDSGAAGFAGVETADGLVQPGVWTHVAGVYDTPRGEARLYVNGEPVATGTGPASPWHASGPLYIGASGIEAGQVHQPFRGSVDEATAWSSTLDPDRIASLGRPVLGGGC